MHCSISWKVMGSIPDGVIGIFHSVNPSSYTVALGLTRPLKEMSTRFISWGEGGKGNLFVRPSPAECLKIWEPQFLEPSGPVQACTGIYLPLYIIQCSVSGQDL